MNLSLEEKLMYKVMMAIYESGIPMSFKGSMVLKACLLEAGYSEDTRHTVDIDGNWVSETMPTQEQMADSMQKALEQNGLYFNVCVGREFGQGRSAGFELYDRESGERLFSMDIDVNRPVSSTRIYELDGMRFLGVSPSQMIADKISAVSTDKVFRRIKDIVDLYYLSQVFGLDKADILQVLADTGRVLENFSGFLHRTDELKHSYEKFRFAGDVNKPSFEDVYQAVKQYIRDFLPNID